MRLDHGERAGMLFNSFEFIFVFLPITLAGFLIVGKLVMAPAARILWLAIASLSFYGYWNIDFLPVIAVSILANFLFATGIAKYSQYSRMIFVAAVAANLAGLGFYKYANFGIQIFNSVAPRQLSPLTITLPLGISFFTFTQIAYLADVLAERARERNFVKYVLFVTYFPHLIAGPIMHHREMMPQFGAAGAPRLSPNRMAIGLTIFTIGLFKKAVIADYLATVVDPVFASAVKGGVACLDAWGGALAYSLQIYFDFSGYCDMAIGISFLFGIILPFNFDAPYKSHSITEFWRRWHITLSRFLRDYVYIPLGGNRYGEARRVCNLLLTMLIGGLWHGAGWTFIVWGALHGLFLAINHAWAALRQYSPALRSAGGTYPSALVSVALTQFCVVAAWVFFRADSLATADRMLTAMAGFSAPTAGKLVSAVSFGVIAGFYLACLVLPNVNELFSRFAVGLDTYHLPRPWSLLRPQWSIGMGWAVATATAFVMSLLAVLAAGGDAPFLYFRF